MYSAQNLIDALDLFPHPEGGYYKETYRSDGVIPSGAANEFPGGRNFATAILFLLTAGNFSALHRIRSDETWHFYEGDPALIVEITPEGQLILTTLGPYMIEGQVFQYTVRSGHWFGSTVKAGGNHSLTGCTVAPGFDFRDFEMGTRAELTERFPHLSDWIERFTRA